MAEKSAYTVTNKYSVEGGKLVRKNPTCPKCGPGVFLAVHKNRKTCGKCGFSEMNHQPAKEVKSEEKAE